MSLLVRKIEMAKWRRRKSDAVEDTPADAITSCLRTSSDSLSVWRIETEERLRQAVLAIVAAGSQLDTMGFVVLRRADLDAHGLTVQQTPMGTCVAQMGDAHFDIVGLTYSSLGKVASAILDVIRKDEVRRFTMNELRELLNHAIDARQLDTSGLNETLRAKLSRGRT